MEFTDKVAPIKDRILKNGLIVIFQKKLIIPDKLFKKSEKTKLHEDKEISKAAQYNVQNLNAKETEEFFEKKLTKRMGKPKDLWKALRLFGLPNNRGGYTVGAQSIENTGCSNGVPDRGGYLGGCQN